MTLDHDDLILLARLIGHHTNDRSESKLDKLGNKLLEYAERAHPGGADALEPLDLRLNPCPLYPKRVMFFEALKP
jgi:hypothetical protein